MAASPPPFSQGEGLCASNLLPGPPRRLQEPSGFPGALPAAEARSAKASEEAEEVNPFTELDGEPMDELDMAQFFIEEESPEAASGERQMMRRILAQQAACLTALTSRTSNDPLQLLSGGGDSSAAGGTGGARGAAARELQRQRMHQHPDEYVRAVRACLARELGSDPSRPQDATAFLRDFGGFEHCREGAFVMQMFCHVWNLLETNRPLAAQALVGTCLGAVDQWGRNGRLDVGFLYTHLPEPPAGCLTRAPQGSQLEPFSRLAPPSWAAGAAAYLRDMEVLDERLGQRPGRRRERTPKDPKAKEAAAKAKEAAAAAAAAARKKD